MSVLKVLLEMTTNWWFMMLELLSPQQIESYWRIYTPEDMAGWLILGNYPDNCDLGEDYFTRVLWNANHEDGPCLQVDRYEGGIDATTYYRLGDALTIRSNDLILFIDLIPQSEKAIYEDNGTMITITLRRSILGASDGHDVIAWFQGEFTVLVSNI